MVQNGKRAKAQIGEVGVIETIHHAQAVIEHIGQTDCRQRTRPITGTGRTGVFDHPAFDRGFLNHRGEFENIHIRHAAISMPRIQIAAEQGKLILGRPGAGRIAPQMGGRFHHLALGPAWYEIRHPNPCRQAGRTLGTRRTVQHVLTTPEALLGQSVIQPLRMFALQRREQLALHPPVQIGTGLRCRHIELGRNRQGMAHLGFA